jgi:hypothetical protein
MNIENIIKLINSPQKIQEIDIVELESIILKYPYFHSGQLLLTKGLLNTNSIRYNQQLKKAAVYSLSRKKIFNLITSNKKDEFNKDNNKKIEPNLTKEELKIGQPLKFKESEAHSFSKWLSLLSVKKIERNEKKLINSFIKKGGKISQPKKEIFFNAIDTAKKSLVENEDLVTPTLAKVYLEQMHLEKAIWSYKKLILKYPEKSSLFAAQIKLIRKLKNK